MASTLACRRNKVLDMGTLHYRRETLTSGQGPIGPTGAASTVDAAAASRRNAHFIILTLGVEEVVKRE